MKKIICLLICISLGHVSIAQKMKVKGNIIKIGGKDIAKIDAKEDAYHFSDLDGELLAIIEFSGREATSSLTEIWYNVSNSDKSVINEVSFKLTAFSLNPKKILASFIQKELHFFDAEGVSVKNIDNFFRSKTVRKGKELYDKIIENEKKGNEWLSQFDVETSNFTLIDKKTKKVIAKIIFQGDDFKLPLSVYDRDEKLILRMQEIESKGVTVGGVNLKLSGNSKMEANALITSWNRQLSKIYFDPTVYKTSDDYVKSLFKSLNRAGFDKVFSEGIKSVNIQNARILSLNFRKLLFDFSDTEGLSGYYIGKKEGKKETKIMIYNTAINIHKGLKLEEDLRADINFKYSDFNLTLVSVFNPDKGDNGKYRGKFPKNSTKFCYQTSDGKETNCYYPYGDVFVKEGLRSEMVK
ncbi:MAG: hypothetical protein COB81_06405 [Flavobacteriaceae bacterium]|nr:MAG: hypothetical protein COB81_06405 [Flavobacteriaceae bacterium]